MQILLYLTDFIVPLVIFGIVGYGLLMKVPVYDTFIKGAKKGFLTVIKIMPTLVGLMVAVGILRASGFLELIANGIGRFTDRIGFPGELVPLTVVKMFSSSAATGLLLDIFKEYGTDSYIGLDCIDQYVVYGDDLLYHECILYDSQSHEDALYINGCAACNSGWCDCQRSAGRV